MNKAESEVEDESQDERDISARLGHIETDDTLNNTIAHSSVRKNLLPGVEVIDLAKLWSYPTCATAMVLEA